MPHPIVAQMQVSEEQMPAIAARNCDVVVTAGAGTGKTRTLVARYLSLLAQEQPLRGTVAITFTKKAAREMRNRVRFEIRRYLETPGLDESERQRWLVLYGELDSARIGTIHSLCGEILRAHPAEARIDPRFEVLDEGQSTILLRQALDEALAWAADQPGIVTLFRLLGERDLRTCLEALLNQRLDAQLAFARQPADILSHWEQLLAQQQKPVLQDLRADPAWVKAVSALRQHRAIKPDDRLAMQQRDILEALDNTKVPLPEQLTALSMLDGIKLNFGSAKAWPGGKDQLSEVKNALDTLRGLWRQHENPLGLRLTSLDKDLAQALPALREVFAFAGNRYTHLKQERNVLDFDDLEHGALELLHQYPSIRTHWQDEIEAILIDEFQDTNPRQRSLVRLLNGDQGRLFIVGDSKQSIYAFRGADVSVFRQEQQRIAAKGGQTLSLNISYRGHRELIQGLNDLLCPILGEEVDPKRPWVEPFAPLEHNREKAGPGFSAPYIELHLALGNKGEGALERAAAAAAKRIVELVRQGSVYTGQQGQTRKLDYNDVAILCRASSSFNAYENAMERAGVPFLTVAGRGFYERPEIRDLLNSLRALADPSDDLALAGLLRSPALALSDIALYVLCQARQQQGASSSLWNVLQEIDPQVLPSTQDRDRAVRAARIVAELHRQAGRTPVADLLKAFLDRTHYRAALIQAGQGRGGRNVSKLLADAHSSGIVGVGEFLEYIRGLRESGAREGEARATTEGAVQIMSVHMAKGLEFPIVVIGDINRDRWRGSPLRIDQDLGVLLPLRDKKGQHSTSYQLGQDRANDQEGAESNRLLYVAATRAREKLLLSGHLSLKNGRPGRMGDWFEKIASPEVLGLSAEIFEYDDSGEQALQRTWQAGQTVVTCTLYEPAWSWTQSVAQPETGGKAAVPLPPPLLGSIEAGHIQLDPRTEEQESIPPQRVWRVVPAVDRPRAPAWVIGSLVHEALAAWRFPKGSPSTGEAAAFDDWARARARSYGIADTHQLNDAIERTKRFLRRFQAHPLYREMNQAERRLHEVPYSIETDRQVESGNIDALYLYQGNWTIVEFKTDRVRDEADLERILAQKKYLEQGQRYITAVEKLLGLQPRFILCMLNYANHIHLL